MTVLIRGHTSRAVLGDLNYYKNESSGDTIIPYLEAIKVLPQGQVDDFLIMNDRAVFIIDGRLYALGRYSPAVNAFQGPIGTIEGLSGQFFEPILLDNVNGASVDGWTSLHIGNRSIDRSNFYAINDSKLFYWGITSSFNGLASGESTSPFVSNLVQMGVGTVYETGWEMVSSGANFSVGIRDGMLFSWGTNANARTGRGTTTGTTSVPTQIGSATNWRMVSCGNDHALAINNNNELFSWGSNRDGRTGRGFSSTGNTFSPTRIGSESDWEICRAGNAVSFGVRDGGKAFSWGWAVAASQGTVVGSFLSPTAISALDSETIVDIQAGSQSGLSFYFLSSNNDLFISGIVDRLKLTDDEFFSIPVDFKTGRGKKTYAVLPSTEFSTRPSSRSDALLISPPYNLSLIDNRKWQKIKTFEDVFIGELDSTIISTP